MARKLNYFYIKLFLIFVALAAIFSINISVAQEGLATPQDIQDGDLIRDYDHHDVYLVKIVGEKRFKRLILNPNIFDSYSHQWNDVKVVSREVLDLYTTSSIVREIGEDERVFHLFPNGDIGTKRHILLETEEFTQAGADPDSIYYINEIESDSYFHNTNTPIDSMEDFKIILERQRQEIEDGISLTPTPEDDSVIFLPPPDLTPPPVGTIIFGESTDTAISISWDEILEADDYEVEYKVQGELDEKYSDTNVTIVGTTATITGLAANTTYIFRIRSVNVYGEGPWSGEQAHQTLLAPVGFLTFYLTTVVQINLRWDAVTGAESYELEYKTGNEGWIREAVTSPDARITGLSPGTTYTFRVRGKNENVIGVWSNERNRSTSLARVGTLNFGTTTVSEINLSWGAIAGATLYDLEYRAGPDGWIRSTITSPEASIVGLQPGTNYTFRVRARNSEVIGSWSQEQTRSTMLDAVEDIAFDIISVYAISLSWSAVAGTNDYYLEYKAGSEPWNLIAITGTTATITNLNSGTEYTFRIRARNGAVVGPWSEEVTRSTSLARVGTLTFGTTTQSAIDLSWEAIMGAASYEVEHKTGNDNWTSIETTTPEAQITNLDSGTEYTFRVRAMRTSVSPYEGEWSTEQTHSTLLAAVGTLTFGTTTTDSINLNWNEITGSTSYEVEHKTGNEDWVSTEVATNSAQITNLDSGTEYTFRVRAKRIDPEPYEGEWSTEQTHSTMLAAVGTLTFGTTTVSEINLSWGAIAGATSYEVEHKTGNEDWIGSTTTNTEAQITGLYFNTEYTFRVRGVRVSPEPFYGAWSSDQFQSTIPVDISNLLFGTTTQSEISLSWGAIESVINYQVQHKAGNTDWTSTEATTNEATITDLDSGTEYTFRVRAMVGNDEGPWSDEATHRTLLAGVGSLNFDMATTEGIDFSWDDIEGATVYEIQYKTGIEDWTSTEAINNEAMIIGLDSGTEYTFRVRATRDSDLGPWSEEHTYSTLLARVGTLTFGVTTDTIINLSWIGLTGATGYEVEYKVKDSSDDTYSNLNVSSTGPTSAVVTSLTANTEYTFRARATRTSPAPLSGAWSEEQDHQTLLAQVGTLTFYETTDTSIDIRWSEVADATSYEVEHKTGTGNWTSTTVTNSRIQLTNLTPYTSYTFRVRAENEDAFGEWSLEQTHSTLIAAVGTLAFGTTTTTSISLSWNEITDATYYEARYHNGNGVYLSANVTVTGTTAIATNLESGIQYTFKVRARRGGDSGEWSEEQTHSTLLARLGNLTFGTTTATSINLSWNAITGAESYEVEHKTGNEDWTTTNVINPEAQITGLIAGAQYTFRARATRTSPAPLSGAWSEEQTHTTFLATVGELTFGITNQSTINLSWSAITDATDYDVQYKTGGGIFTDTNVIVEGVTSHVTNLTSGTEYTFRVRAKNENIVGQWSLEQAHWTHLATVGELTVGTTTVSEIDLSWDAIGGAESYEVEHKTGSENWTNTTVANPELRLTNLLPGSTYTFRARAIRTSASPYEGAWSSDQTHSTLIETIGNLTFAETTDTTINLRWSAITGATIYDVQYKVGSGNWTEINTTTPEAQAINLNANTTYIFRVRARGADVTGEWSEEQNSSTLLARINALNFDAISDSSISISWSSISGAIYYQVEYRTGNNPWEIETVLNPNVVITDLTPGTAYTFRAKSLRTSPIPVEALWSEEQTRSTLVGIVGDLTFEETTDTVINLSWDAITGATSYNIHYKIGNGNWSERNATTSTAQITNLIPNTEYTFRVRARNAEGSGAWSFEQNHSTLLARVGNISFSSPSNTQINLDWSNIADAAIYEVNYKTGTNNWTSISVINSSAQITGLTSNTLYTFRVRATGENNVGAWSQEQSYSIGLISVGTITFGPITSTSITLSWDAVPGVILGYVIQYKSDQGDWITAYPGQVVSLTSNEITGLDPSTEYTFRIKAVNALEEGPWSLEQAYSTLS